MSTEIAVRRFPLGAVPLLAVLGMLAVSVLVNSSTEVVTLGVFLCAVLALTHRVLLRWESMLAAIVLIVVFIPIKRYTLPASLPFELEAYRLLVAVVIVCWGLSLVIDPRIQLRRTAFDAPLLFVVAAFLASDVANPGRVDQYGSFVAKGFTFFLSFVVVYYFAANAIRSRRALDGMLGLLVASCAVVAVASVNERRTGFNIFEQLEGPIPFLNFVGAGQSPQGGDRLRVFGSAQHPIALGALFAMLIPVGLALAYRRGRIWWIPTAILGLGVMASSSRTPIVMLVMAAGIFIWLKPGAMKRLGPLAVPAVVVSHLFVPGAIGTIRAAFFPAEGLIAEQSVLEEGNDPLLAGGRIRLIRPSINEWAQRPAFGQGYGTRIVGFTEPRRNAPILDNQWLASLVEVGLIGFLGLLWLFARAFRRLTSAARAGPEDDGWLFAGLAAAIASFGVGMLTFDAFSFIQVTLVFWILLGLSAVALRLQTDEARLCTADGLANPSR